MQQFTREALGLAVPWHTNSARSNQTHDKVLWTNDAGRRRA